MKPSRIILIRHGESQGNIDKNVYKDIPDYALQLTPKGIKQALMVGEEISKITSGSYQFYVSPFWRTRQTYLHLRRYLPINHNYYEDPRIREQEWCGKLRKDGFMHEDEAERDAFGHFYYRFKGGESCADVYDRISDFIGTMFRDFDKPHYSDNAIVVTHGMTMRLFLMRFFHASVEEFELWGNPKNCGYFLLEKQPDDKYILKTHLRKHEMRHSFQFPQLEDLNLYKTYNGKFNYECS